MLWPCLSENLNRRRNDDGGDDDDGGGDEQLEQLLSWLDDLLMLSSSL